VYEKEIDIKEVLLLLKRHYLSFASVIIIVLSLTAAYIFRSPKIYMSTASIEIEPKAPNVLGSGMEIVSAGSQGYFYTNKEYYSTQYEIIQSRAVSSKVLELIQGDDVLTFLGVKTDKMDDDAKKRLDPVSIVQQKITVSPQKNSNMVNISVEDTDPEKASFLANSVAEAYIDFNLEKRYFATKDAAKWLLAQSLNLKKNLEGSEKVLFDFKSDNNVLSTTFEEKQSLLSSTITKLTNKLTDQSILKNSITSKIEEYAKSDTENPEEMFLKEVSKDSSVARDLKIKYLEAGSRLDEKEKFYGEKHPVIMGLKAESGNLLSALKVEVQGVINSYKLELDTLENEMSKNSQMLKKTQKESIDLNKLDIQYSKLKREVETNKKLFDIVLERAKQADLSALLKNNNIRIIDAAKVSIIPVKPRKKLIFMIGLIISVVLGFLIVFVIEFFDNRFRSFKEVENLCGKTIVGVIPLYEIEKSNTADEIVFDSKHKGHTVESLRSLRTSIRLVDPDKDIRTILVTSSVTKEGKTNISTNLAVSYALAGKKTLLVDADMRKPRVNKIFDIDRKGGLCSVIVGDKSFDEVVHRDLFHGLDVLTSGSIPINPAELLESKRFLTVIDIMKSKYDIIVFDSPPLNPVNDAISISSNVDAVVLVVNIDSTPRDVFKMSAKRLTNPTINFIGPIVNKFDMEKRRHFKKYHDQFYYEKAYYEEGKDES